MVSTITGLGRVLLSLVHTIVHLASAIFDARNRSEHLEEASLGAINFARGWIEMIPVVGNIAMFVADLVRSTQFLDEVNEIITKNSEYNAYAMVFGKGKEIARKPLNEFNAQVEFLSKTQSVSSEDKIKIIQNL